MKCFGILIFCYTRGVERERRRVGCRCLPRIYGEHGCMVGWSLRLGNLIFNFTFLDISDISCGWVSRSVTFYDSATYILWGAWLGEPSAWGI